MKKTKKENNKTLVVGTIMMIASPAAAWIAYHLVDKACSVQMYSFCNMRLSGGLYMPIYTGAAFALIGSILVIVGTRNYRKN